MVLRGKIRLDACTIPPSVMDMMAGMGCHQDGLFSLTDNGHLVQTPPDGCIQPTSVVQQAVKIYAAYHF